MTQTPPIDHDAILAWYDDHARDLPWRGPAATPWSVLVSEFMLQQTPVARVIPVHAAWLERWPTPPELAGSATGDAVRMWGRLGYPRRALRLHATAVRITEDHEGQVPSLHADLLALPGVGDYTAAAVASFAFGQRHVVLDTNVRRVFARALAGQELPERQLSSAERALAARVLPEAPQRAAAWAVAVMELGALVCTATAPSCHRCPIRDDCAWFADGRPAYDGPPRLAQTWAGTDRQCRGRLLAVIRENDAPVPRDRLDLAWHEAVQRERCLRSLVTDGLVVEVARETFALP